MPRAWNSSASVLQRGVESAWKELSCSTWRSSQTSESGEAAQEPWSWKRWPVKGFISCVLAGFTAILFLTISLASFPHTKETSYISKIVSPRERACVCIYFLCWYLKVFSKTPSDISGPLVSWQWTAPFWVISKIKLLALPVHFASSFPIVSCDVCRKFGRQNVSKYEENFRKPD